MEKNIDVTKMAGGRMIFTVYEIDRRLYNYEKPHRRSMHCYSPGDVFYICRKGYYYRVVVS